jgi:hypothetical protein
VIVVLAVAGVAFEVQRAAPRDVDVRFELGSDHGSVTEARIVYSSEGEVVHGVRFGYPGGAPKTVPHHVALTPGRYRIDAALHGPTFERHVEAVLEVPADGTVRVDLTAQEARR